MKSNSNGGVIIFNFRCSALISFIIVCGILMQGCISFLAGTAGGGEAFAYHQGELRSTEKVSIHTVWDATVNAINKLGFEVKKKAKDDVSAVLSAETAQDDSIHIELDRIKDNRTKISIRINYFGDEKLSKHIYQTIKERYE